MYLGLSKVSSIVVCGFVGLKAVVRGLPESNTNSVGGDLDDPQLGMGCEGRPLRTVAEFLSILPTFPKRLYARNFEMSPWCWGRSTT